MLDIITRRNNVASSRDAENVLILYDHEKKAFIGDSYILINKLASCRSFFTRASIDINCRNKEHTKLFSALLQNNPYIRHFNNLGWEELDFQRYDIVFIISRNEGLLLKLLQERYGQQSDYSWATSVYSMSVQFLNFGPDPVTSSIFPPFRDILDNHGEHLPSMSAELYISEHEKDRANQWLRENGLKEHELLYIVLDSTSEREKLISMDTYYKLLCHLTDQESIKLLIYDEQNIGKDIFYRELLGPERASKIIFARKLGLREDLCILSSEYTKLIFGPCTGLIHCASGIFNYYVRKGMPAASVPPIITYTGKYMDGHTAAYWWATSPLVTCLIIRAAANKRKEAVLLHELSEEEKRDTESLLLCEEYTVDQLTSRLPVHSHTMLI